MGKEKEPKPRLAIKVWLEHDNRSYDNKPTAWMRAKVVIIESHNGMTHTHPRSYSNESRFDYIEMRGLLVSDISKDRQTCDGASIVVRDLYSATLYEMEAITKTLRSITNKVKALDDKLGWAL